MLSEAYVLHRNLDESGFEVTTRHPRISSPGKRPGYRVSLDSDGTPADVVEQSREDMAALWRHREGKQNSFPVVNIQHALLQVPFGHPIRERLKKLQKSKTGERIRLLREARICFPIFLPATDEQMWKRLRQKAKRLQPAFTGQDPQFRAMPLLLERFGQSAVEPADFFRKLVTLLIRRLKDARLEDVLLAEKLLLGNLHPKRPGKPATADVFLALDVAEPDLPIYVADSKMESHVNRCLLGSSAGNGTQTGNSVGTRTKRRLQHRSGNADSAKGECAVSGTKDVPLVRGGFPEPNLGPLGETKLFSRNIDAPCEARYGRNGAEAMPVSEETAIRAADALRYITREEWKGRTWREVANGKWEGSGDNKREKKDLLIVYVEGQPVLDAAVADLFGSDKRELHKQFTTDAAAVCEAFRGILTHQPDARLHILLLRKVDKEKKQLALAESPRVQDVLDAAERWQRAVQESLPVIKLPLPPKKGHPLVWSQPLPPYPEEVVRILARQWVRGGTEDHKIEGISFGEVLVLMLRTEGKWESTAERIQDLLLRRLSPLLIGVGGAKLSYVDRDRNHWGDFVQSRWMALQAVALIGILLDAFNSKKEVYMQDSAYQVGHVLALADTLHKDYCIVVRDGQLPPSLIGNALMARALDDPSGALAELAERMRIYIGWAKTAEVPKGDGEDLEQRRIAVHEARKTLRRYEPLAMRLHQAGIPTSCDNIMKAQVLLGYLASADEEPQANGGGDQTHNNPHEERDDER